MFLHNLKYTLKIIFKNKGLVFWTFLFPLVLSTLFNLAFKDIGKSAKLELIKIGIINDNNFKSNIVLKDSFESLSDKNNKDRLFITKYVTEEKAKKLLQDDKIVVALDIEQALAVTKGLQLFQDKLKSEMHHDSFLNYNPTLDLTERIKRYIQSDVDILYNKIDSNGSNKWRIQELKKK